jgi:hypothetical protein
VGPLVALYKEAHPTPKSATRLPNPDERPHVATAPHRVWFADVRSRVKVDNHWRYSILIVDGHSRAIVGAGCFARQTLSRVVQVCRPAIARWGAPDARVSDNAGVLRALRPCLHQLGIRWAPIARGHPWQDLAESGVAGQRRVLDAYVLGCTERTTAYQQHAPFVRDYQSWGHWAHKRRDAPGRIDYLSPEVILGSAQGRMIDPSRLRRLFRLRQLTRLVRQPGHIRLRHFGLDVDPGLWGQTVEVLIYDEAVRIEPGDHLLVSSPCVDEPGQRRITAVDAQGRQQYRHVQAIQVLLFTLGLVRSVGRMPLYRRRPRTQQALAALQPHLFAPWQINPCTSV